MLKLLIYLFIFFLPLNNPHGENNTEILVSESSSKSDYQKLYDEMQLDGIVNYEAFEQAMIGYAKIKTQKKDIITLIDFSKPSTEERLYIFDIKKRKLIFKSHVSHGKNSGENYATSFSNKNGSNKSSLGFFITGNTYQGKNGYSLILNGLEKGINDNARERSIVIHGAAYSDPSRISVSGRLGRSLGCPALPISVSKPIISTIKDGTILYIYAENKNYMAHSSILSSYSCKGTL